MSPADCQLRLEEHLSTQQSKLPGESCSVSRNIAKATVIPQRKQEACPLTPKTLDELQNYESSLNSVVALAHFPVTA